jgi:hypothetical protein
MRFGQEVHNLTGHYRAYRYYDISALKKMESAELFKALKGSVFYLSPESPKNGSGKEKKGVIDGVRTIFFVRNHF